MLLAGTVNKAPYDSKVKRIHNPPISPRSTNFFCLLNEDASFYMASFGQMTARDIGIRAKTHKTKISRAVFRLDKNNLIMRTSSEKDRRIELLSLTKKGAGVYNDLKNEAELFEEKVSEHFSNNEINVLKRCLEKIEKQFNLGEKFGSRNH